MRYLRCDSARCQRLHALLSSNGCGQCRPASRRAGMNRPAPQRIPCQVSLCCAACGHQQQAFIVQRAPEGRTNPGRITALRPCRAQWPWPLYKLRCCVAGIYQKNRKKGTHVCVDITFKIERTSHVTPLRQSSAGRHSGRSSRPMQHRSVRCHPLPVRLFDVLLTCCTSKTKLDEAQQWGGGANWNVVYTCASRDESQRRPGSRK